MNTYIAITNLQKSLRNFQIILHENFKKMNVVAIATPAKQIKSDNVCLHRRCRLKQTMSAAEGRLKQAMPAKKRGLPRESSRIKIGFV
jgi:hypothetical protein